MIQHRKLSNWSGAPKTLLALAGVSFCAGVFFRFWGLGSAPLAVDEYYLGTSILNIAERGLPEFQCGGYYVRGIFLQYVSLLAVFLGANLELAVRLIPAISSIVSIAAVWKLGNRVGGVSAACIAVVLVSLSLWEIEFARFGRMYSPFQAIFLWYAYFQLKHLQDNDRASQFVYLLLSGLSIFVYAGSAMLLALNFLPLLWPEKRWGAGHLIAATGLMAVGLNFYRFDFRYMGVPESELPPAPTIDAAVQSVAPSLPLPIEVPLIPGTGPFIVIIGIIAIALLILSHYKYLKPTHPSVLLWLLALLAIGFGLISFGIALVLVGVLSRAPLPLDNIANLRQRLIRVYLPTVILLVSAIFLGALLSRPDFIPAAKDTLNYLLNYPDVYYKVVRPWLFTIPLTTIVFAALIVPLFWLSMKNADEESDRLAPLRYLFSILIALVLLVGLLRQPYITTRYTYFLYPIVLVLASVGVARLFDRVGKRSPRLSLFAAFGAFLLLLLTEDFGIDHLVRINQPDIRYRLQYREKLADHYYKRWDFRSVGQYVSRHSDANDVVIVFHQAISHYLHRTDGVFVRKGGTIHSITWGCGGTRELWSNAKLLDEDHEVVATIESNTATTWLVMHTPQYPWRDQLEADLVERFDLEPYYTSVDGNLAVFRVSSQHFQMQQQAQTGPAGQ